MKKGELNRHVKQDKGKGRRRMDKRGGVKGGEVKPYGHEGVGQHGKKKDRNSRKKNSRDTHTLTSKIEKGGGRQ